MPPLPDPARLRVLLGDCVEVMGTLDAESVDAVVCDPPYGLEFMGKEWDSFRRDDPGTNRHRGEYAGEHGEIAEVGEGGHSRVGIGGGKRPTTSRCTGCGRRDQFRKDHGCAESARWATEILDPYAAPPTMLAFQEWTRLWALAVYRILKPGGHVLAFGGTRTYHRLAAGLEDAGFEIRDSLHWIYGSGFPKSHDVSKAIDKKLGGDREPDTMDGREQVMDNQVLGRGLGVGIVERGAPATEAAAAWDGWGTALKPAHEPIILARKPLGGTVAENVLKFGTGALHIDSCRPVGEPGSRAVERPKGPSGGSTSFGKSATVREPVEAGRWPANVLLSHLAECEGVGASHTDVLCAPGCPVAELNEMSGESISPTGAVSYSQPSSPATPSGANPESAAHRRTVTVAGLGDSGGAARFFYIAKPRTRERIGGTLRNLHPTVKPVELMRYLVRLVTPPDGIVLDPFLGSGTTGCAAVAEGLRFIGIERDPESHETALARVSDWAFAHGADRPSVS